MHGITLVVLAFVGVAVSYAETVKKPENNQETVLVSRPGQTKPARPLVSTLPFRPDTKPGGFRPDFTLQVEPMKGNSDDKPQPEGKPAQQAAARFLWNLLGGNNGNTNSTSGSLPNLSFSSFSNLLG